MIALSKARAVTDLTVSAVCREAGISRDSFYRLASSPEELLADYLYEDHDVAPVIDAEAEPDATGLVAAMRILVEHVQRNLVIYRNCVDPHFPPLIQDALLRRMNQVLAWHVAAHPDRIPQLDVGRHEEVTDAFVSYLAFATLGAIESLVRSGGIEDDDLSIAILYTAIAPVWIHGEDELGAVTPGVNGGAEATD